MKTKYIEKPNKFILIGTSAGGINALRELLKPLDREFPYPIVLVIHRLKNVRSHLENVLQKFTLLKVKQAEEKEELKAGVLYVAPSNYHLMLEEDLSFSLTVDELVNFSRPSIDVSLVSFSEILKNKLLAVILTGANSDGADGAQVVYENGGKVWVQDPETAYVKTMPQAALEKVPDAEILDLEEMTLELLSL